MALELKQKQADILAQLLVNPQGNRTKQHRRAPQITEKQILKGKELLALKTPPHKIRAACDLSIYKYRKLRDGAYDFMLTQNFTPGTRRTK